MGRVEIADSDFQEAPYMACAEATIGILLKSKGVPLLGIFIPKPDPRLIYTSYRDSSRCRTIITWKPNPQEKV